jgi:glycosyltransferase involved in cell wall biosynthesis
VSGLRLLFVVQRYGAEVCGGAEQHCREFATRLAARGHRVEVVTSCAVDYVDWANAYPPGETTLDGVRVHRLPVARERDNARFGPLNARVFASPARVAPHLQREWMRQQGPFLPQLPSWLAERSSSFDLNVFFTYLYFTTWAGLGAAARPTVLHPTAHDEPMIRLPLFDQVFERADAYAFGSEEERALVRRRFGFERPSEVIGIGIEVERPGDAEAFRRRFGLGDRPYVVYVGRLDPNKGAVELFRYFTAYKKRRPGPLALALIGQEVTKLPRHPDVFKTGFVDDATKDAGLSGAELLIQPSYFESFSMVLHEAWAARVPALVQARCEVLVGQSRRSGAGLPYSGYAEFEAALDLLLEDDGLRRRMGSAGRGFVERNYHWPRLLARYESFLDSLLALPRSGRGHGHPPPSRGKAGVGATG